MKPKLLLSLTTNGHIYGGAFAGCGADVTVKHIPEISTDYDGLVLCGGDDVDPQYYGQENTACGELEQERDKTEFALLDAFVRAGKPVLGICRGQQLINVYFGGSLIQHMAETPIHRQSMEHYCTHEVTAEADSIAGKLYGENFRVNSCHHQAIDRLGNNLKVTAQADNIIEAVEHETLPVFAVQWHPEKLCFDYLRPDAVDGQPLIQYFVNFCKSRSDNP